MKYGLSLCYYRRSRKIRKTTFPKETNPEKLLTSKRKRMDLFITKNKKLDRLITYSPSIAPDCNIPIINLLTIYWNQKELNQLKMGLDYTFVDKNKGVKENIAANMESVIEAVDKDIDNEK